MSSASHFPPLPLPPGITESYVECPVIGMTFHILESGHTAKRDKPLILLLHGYPELAYSWRKVMPTLADAGYYVVAPDQRGYGRTTGWANVPYDQVDLRDYSTTNMVRDMVVLVHALGYQKVGCVVGHDFGAVAASMCALMRPDLFTSCITMSHPFKGAPSVPFNTAHSDSTPSSSTTGISGRNIQSDLAALTPPRKHYQWYNSTPSAAADWDHPEQGMAAFLRGYFHTKSASYTGPDATPHALSGWSAAALAALPHYYIMPLDASMPQAIAGMMATQDAGRAAPWLGEAELAVYAGEWARTGFQGALNWYRASTDAARARDALLFAGRSLAVPSAFVSGARDWGNFQQPGAVERLPLVCERFLGVRWIDNAGHWPQQENPAQVCEEVLAFLRRVESGEADRGKI